MLVVESYTNHTATRISKSCSHHTTPHHTSEAELASHTHTTRERERELAREDDVNELYLSTQESPRSFGQLRNIGLLGSVKKQCGILNKEQYTAQAATIAL
jgi:hypothetical protein